MSSHWKHRCFSQWTSLIFSKDSSIIHLKHSVVACFHCFLASLSPVSAAGPFSCITHKLLMICGPSLTRYSPENFYRYNLIVSYVVREYIWAGAGVMAGLHAGGWMLFYKVLYTRLGWVSREGEDIGMAGDGWCWRCCNLLAKWPCTVFLHRLSSVYVVSSLLSISCVSVRDVNPVW